MRYIFFFIVLLLSCRQISDQIVKNYLEEINIRTEIDVISIESEVITAGPMGSDSYTNKYFHISSDSHNLLIQEITDNFEIDNLNEPIRNFTASEYWGKDEKYYTLVRANAKESREYTLKVDHKKPIIVLTTM